MRGWGKVGMGLGKRRVTAEDRVKVGGRRDVHQPDVGSRLCPWHSTFRNGVYSFPTTLCNVGEHCIDINYYII